MEAASNILLCGLPSAGKTTVGKLLAKKLKWSFVDSDLLIEALDFEKTGTKNSCRVIYQRIGEYPFRLLETSALQTLVNRQQCVIALGGGSLECEENRSLIRTLGTIIYLDTPIDLAWSRLIANGIPPYLSANNPLAAFHNLAQKRTPHFSSLANITIKKIAQPEVLCQAILSALHFE